MDLRQPEIGGAAEQLKGLKSQQGTGPVTYICSEMLSVLLSADVLDLS